MIEELEVWAHIEIACYFDELRFCFLKKLFC
jgi:hypothetical protein